MKNRTADGLDFDYLKAPYWDVREAVILLLGGKPINDDGLITARGMPPLGRNEPNPIEAIVELACRSIDAGDLPFVGKKANHRRVAPADFCRWAIEKGYEVPDGWEAAFLPSENKPAAATRQDDLSIELADILNQMDELGESATAASVMLKLQDRAQWRNGTCIKDAGVGYVMYRNDRTGKTKKLDMEALQKRLARRKGTPKGR